MARRYSRIKQGALYNAGLQNYIQYLQTAATRPRNIGTRGARGDTALAYITPFGFDVAVDELANSRVNPEDYTALSTYINGAGTGAEVSNTLGANNLIDEKGFRAARVIWFNNATRNVTVERSDVTQIQYLKYTGDRRSCPFGRATATDDQIDAFNGVKAAIVQARSGDAINRVSLQREVAPI